MKKFLLNSLLLLGALQAEDVQDSIEQVHAKYIKPLQESTELKFVQVTASWCGPCKGMYPIVDEVKKDFPKISFEKLPVERLMKRDDNVVKALKETFDVTINSIPTFLLFKDGTLVKVLIGSRDKDDLTSWLKKLETTSVAEFAKEERDDLPEQMKKMQQMQSKPYLEKLFHELDNIIKFIENPAENIALKKDLLETETVKSMEEQVNVLNFIKNSESDKDLQDTVLKSNLFKQFKDAKSNLQKMINSL
jgi:thioredoxin 1